jgi:hypothetical protein
LKSTEEMMSSVFKAVLACLLMAQVASFLQPGARLRPTIMMRTPVDSMDITRFNAANVIVPAIIAATPAVAFADEIGGGSQTAVLVPLIISVLTIIPFWYYSK